MASMEGPTEVEQVKQFREFLISYNRLSESCFHDCVHDFTTRHVRDKEFDCANNCVMKYLKINQRITQRFQEIQVMANENVLAAMQKAGNAS